MSITISTTDYPDEVRAKLQQEERYFKSLGIDFNIDENKSKEFTLFEFNFKEAGYLNYNEYLADIVAEVVIDDLEKKLIDNIIKHKYNQFTKEEKLEIQKLSLKHLDELNMTEEKLLPKIVRKKEIIIQLLKYLEMHRDLNIEGFVRFRLKNYLYKLKLAVEQAVDDLIIEKEYVEFIDLLKYFVDLQEPKIDLVNVLKNDDGNFILLDKTTEGRKINWLILQIYLESQDHQRKWPRIGLSLFWSMTELMYLPSLWI